MKILLIEDDTETAEHIIESLQQHGHVIDHASNGRDGLFLATGPVFTGNHPGAVFTICFDGRSK